jgi:HlyD family secretion protein
LRLLADSVARAEELASKNLIQTSQLLALQREAASLTGQRANTISVVASANGRIAQVDSEKARLIAMRKQEAATELAQVREDYVRQSDEMDILALKIDRLEIRAPVAGIVHGMTVRGAGSVVRPATPVLHIVPQGVLVVEVHIEPTHIDSVFPGQTVLLRFPAFDTRTTPELDGKIARVAADVTVDERNGVAAYIAEIDVAADELARLGQKKLIPGMPVEAYIQTGERSPLSYIAKPFTDYFARAFRD